MSNDGHNNAGNIPMFPTQVSVPMSSPLGHPTTSTYSWRMYLQHNIQIKNNLFVVI